MTESIRILGDKELNNFLKGLPASFSHRILQTANSKAAKPLINAEKLLAPKREGDLRESIGIKRTNIKKVNAVGEIKVGPLYRKGGRAAHLIEFGTKQRKLKGNGQYRAGTNRGAIKPQPFVEPAFNRTKDEVKSGMLDGLRKSVESFSKRTLKKFG